VEDGWRRRHIVIAQLCGIGLEAVVGAVAIELVVQLLLSVLAVFPHPLHSRHLPFLKTLQVNFEVFVGFVLLLFVVKILVEVLLLLYRVTISVQLPHPHLERVRVGVLSASAWGGKVLFLPGEPIPLPMLDDQPTGLARGHIDGNCVCVDEGCLERLLFVLLLATGLQDSLTVELVLLEGFRNDPFQLLLVVLLVPILILRYDLVD